MSDEQEHMIKFICKYREIINDIPYCRFDGNFRYCKLQCVNKE